MTLLIIFFAITGIAMIYTTVFVWIAWRKGDLKIHRKNQKPKIWGITETGDPEE